MTGLGLSFEDLYKQVSHFLGLGLAPAGEDLALAKRYVNDGYRTFLMGLDERAGRAHQWSFLAPAAVLDVWPDLAGTCTALSYDAQTGRTTVTNTPAADAFYPSVVGHDIAFAASGNAYAIVEYVDATKVKVAGDITGAESPTDGYAVAADGAYSLPEDFAALIDGFTHAPGGPCAALVPRSPQHVRQLRSAGPASGPPRVYAIQPRAFDAAAGQRHEVLLWPTGGAHTVLHYRYRLEPPALEADADRPMGGPQHAATILAAALMTAEQRHNDTVGPHTAAFGKLLAASIDLDAANKPRCLGVFGGPDAPPALDRRAAAVTYP